MADKLSPLDYILVIVYLVGILLLGLWVSRKLKTGTDFFLAGRNLPWWAIGFSLVATDIGGTDIIGVGGTSFTHGLAVANFEWIGCVPAMIVAAFVFVPHFWRIGITTIPEFMEKRFNVGVRSALALCWVIFMACNLGIMLLASAKLMNVLLGWDQAVCIVVTALLAGFYTAAGGLAAVVYTDVIQGTVLIAGCLLVVVLGLYDIGGPQKLQQEVEKQEQKLQEKAAEQPQESVVGERTKLILPVETKSPFPWPAILFGLALILSPAYWIGNQAIVQRSLGAKSDFDAKASYVWGALLKNVIPFVIAVPGLIAFVRLTDLQDGDKAIPQLVAELLPTGIRGIFLAAFLAALMSSFDSYLNSASTILTLDFYKRFWHQNVEDRQILWIGRGITLVLVGWAICFAFLCNILNEGIYTIFQTLMSFFQGPALAILLTGLLWKRATGIAAFTGFLAGVLTSVTLFILNQEAVYKALGWQPLFRIPDPFLYLNVWAFVAAMLVIIVVSCGTPPEPAEKLRYLIGQPNNEKES